MSHSFLFFSPPCVSSLFPSPTQVLDYKAGRLSALSGLTPVCHRVAIAADVITDDWESKLIEQGFDKESPSVWLAEGLLVYLPKKEARQLLQRAAAMAANGSFFGADAMNPMVLKLGAAKGAAKHLRQQGAPLLFGVSKPEKFLRSCGWNCPKVYQHGDKAVSHGRWPVLPTPRWIPSWAPIPRFWLLSATIKK